MAYDRFDPRRGNDPDSRWRDQEQSPRRPGHDERGFFERAGEQISSWFGDDDPRGRSERGGPPSRGSWGREEWPGRSSQDRFQGSEDDYRPMTGDYGRIEQDRGSFGGSGRGGGRGMGGQDSSRQQYGRQDFSQDREGMANRSAMAGGSRTTGGAHDPHYSEWRQRHLDSLDRDYDEYRRENQSRFESEFSSWRDQRQSKRQMLGQVRQHMEVLGSDQQHLGTVDRVAGDRLILAKSDEAAGGAQHSLSCSALDRIEGDKLLLNCTADQAMKQWRDDSRDRALFEREDQGEAGPGILNRSFSGTY